MQYMPLVKFRLRNLRTLINDKRWYPDLSISRYKSLSI